MQKQQSCIIAQNNIAFIEKSAYMCCLTNHEGGGFIKLIDNYQDEEVDWNDVFKRKQNILDTMRSGEVPPACKGCTFLKYTDDEQLSYKFLSFNIAPFVPCNCQCIYCTIWEKPYQKDIRFTPFIKSMYEKDLIQQTKDTFMSVSGGEPLLIKDFEELIYTSAECGIYNFDINTTGIILSKAVLDMLSRKDRYINVTVSLDSGNSELYKKIKRVDCFDKVINNLKEYIKHQNGDFSQVRTKYIIIPNVNDNKKDILEWYKLSEKIGIKSVILDVEREWFAKNGWEIPKEYKKLIEMINKNAEKDGISVGYYESLRNYMER